MLIIKFLFLFSPDLCSLLVMHSVIHDQPFWPREPQHYWRISRIGFQSVKLSFLSAVFHRRAGTLIPVPTSILSWVKNCLLPTWSDSWINCLQGVRNPQILIGRSQNSYPALCNGDVSHGAPIGVFGFLPTTHLERNANKMCPQSLDAVRHFIRVYLHVQTRVHTPDKLWLFDPGKTQIPQIRAPCRNKNSAGSGITDLYLYRNPTSLCLKHMWFLTPSCLFSV